MLSFNIIFGHFSCWLTRAVLFLLRNCCSISTELQFRFQWVDFLESCRFFATQHIAIRHCRFVSIFHIIFLNVEHKIFVYQIIDVDNKGNNVKTKRNQPRKKKVHIFVACVHAWPASFPLIVPILHNNMASSLSFTLFSSHKSYTTIRAFAHISSHFVMLFARFTAPQCVCWSIVDIHDKSNLLP